MKKSSSLFNLACRTGAVLLSTVALYFAQPVIAGEFPDDWTWDDKPEARAEHAHGHGHHEVENPQDIPHPVSSTGGK